jgi:hypothetical protein
MKLSSAIKSSGMESRILDSMPDSVAIAIHYLPRN